MLVHFIGGPAHGLTESVKSPPTIIKMPQMPEPSVVYFEDAPDQFSPIEPTWDVLEYRITRHTRRYAIAEFIEPKVMARVQVNVKVSLYESAVLNALHRWVFERREDLGQPGPVKLVSVCTESTGCITLDLQTLVDGPPDAAATAEAGENVQHFLDSHLPRDIRHKLSITQTGVSVDG